MTRFRLILLVIIGGVFLVGNWAVAVGVSVKPKEINLAIKTGRSTTTEILVVNAGQQPAIYQIYPDNFQDQISVKPAEFQLEPEANQLVAVTVKTNWPAKLVTNLSVVARPLAAGGFLAGSGVKVPVQVIATGWPLWVLVLVTLIVSFLLLVFVLKLLKKESRL